MTIVLYSFFISLILNENIHFSNVSSMRAIVKMTDGVLGWGCDSVREHQPNTGRTLGSVPSVVNNIKANQK